MSCRICSLPLRSPTRLQLSGHTSHSSILREVVQGDPYSSETGRQWESVSWWPPMGVRDVSGRSPLNRPTMLSRSGRITRSSSRSQICCPSSLCLGGLCVYVQGHQGTMMATFSYSHTHAVFHIIFLSPPKILKVNDITIKAKVIEFSHKFSNP